MPNYYCICSFCGFEGNETLTKESERVQRCPKCRTWNYVKPEKSTKKPEKDINL